MRVRLAGQDGGGWPKATSLASVSLSPLLQTPASLIGNHLRRAAGSSMESFSRPRTSTSLISATWPLGGWKPKRMLSLPCSLQLSIKKKPRLVLDLRSRMSASMYVIRVFARRLLRQSATTSMPHATIRKGGLDASEQSSLSGAGKTIVARSVEPRWRLHSLSFVGGKKT